MRSICSVSKVRVVSALFALSMPILSHAEHLKLSVVRGAAFAYAQGRSVSLARGQALASPAQVSVGNQGAVALEGDRGSRLSIIGPAEFEYVESAGTPTLMLRYGDLYVKGTSQEAFRIQTPHRSLDAGAHEFYVELQPITGALRVRNVGESDLQVGEQNLEPRQILQVSPSGAEWISALDEEDLRRVENRHGNVRIGQNPLETAAREEKTPPSREPLHFMARLNWVSGVSRFSPSANSSFVQDLGSFGGSGRFSLRYHFGAKAGAPREEFLRAPTLELGLELMGQGAWLGLSSVATGRAFNLLAFVPLGFSFYQFQITALPGVMLFDLRHETAATPIVPVAVGAEAEYRIDLGEVTDSELGLSLGLRYLYMRMQATNDSAGASVTPSSFAWQYVALVTALSYRF
jgi:hypothetical protein